MSFLAATLVCSHSNQKPNVSAESRNAVVTSHSKPTLSENPYIDDSGKNKASHSTRSQSAQTILRRWFSGVARNFEI